MYFSVIYWTVRKGNSRAPNINYRSEVKNCLIVLNFGLGNFCGRYPLNGEFNPLNMRRMGNYGDPDQVYGSCDAVPKLL